VLQGLLPREDHVVEARGGVALLPYLVAKPGQETQADLAAARQSSVNNRYGV
jgi:hypothetical protein